MAPDIAVSVVVPAYNEEGRLEPTVREIAEYFRASGRSIECIVVDDGSRDGTSGVAAALAAEFPEVRLIRLAENRGKGYAVRSGMVNARGALVLFTDADGATPIAELERLEAAVAAGADVAIGSRGLAGAGVTVRARTYRRWIGRAFHLLVRLLATGKYVDTQCGFKLFRGEVAHDLFSRMRTAGFGFDVELLVMAEQRGYAVAEVPVNWTHRAGSKVNLASDCLAMAWDVARVRARCLRGNYRTPHIAPWAGLAAGRS
ncbi:MAG TPA: dolichyl-phosphate beta-glucosyltransferase [Gemmatimonadales bacterium]|nr:dolichyl-phosphate beta-glucosyltransferase [Gemmatimonadales bacterium]